MNQDAPQIAAEEFSKYIKALREDRGLGLRQAAQKADISPGHMQDLESGRRTPRRATLNKLAHAYEVPVASLLAHFGYMPDLATYLCDRYGPLPEEALDDACAYMERLVTEYGLDPRGPINREDETNPPQTQH